MTELVLDSKYVVSIRLMGPFAFDHIEQKYRDPDPVMREITTATGDVYPWLYEPDEVPPHPEAEPEEYELWVRWKSREYECAQSSMKRRRETAHFFMLEAMEVVRGPQWNLINAVFKKFKLWRRLFCRTSDGFFYRDRYLHWLKTTVIASMNDWQYIQQAATAREVTMDGILDAARRFQRVVGQDGLTESLRVAARGPGEL